MRVRYGAVGKEMDLQEAIKNTLLETSYGAGQLEGLQDRINNIADSVSHLLALLVDKGVMTLDDVNAVVGPLYPFKEVKS